MRDLPIFASGTLATSTTKIAHLFELELARLKVMATATAGSTTIVVDDIDKCFIGQILCFIPNTIKDQATDPAKSYHPEFIEVTDISLILNQITLATATTWALAINDYLYETVYDEAQTPSLEAYQDTREYRLQLWHSAYGTLNGYLLFTDFDIPIITTLSNGIYGDQFDNYGVYIPYPIAHKGTSYDAHGKMSQLSIDVSNHEQLFSNLVLTHEGLRKRKIKVYSLFLDNAEEINLNVPIQVTADVVIKAGVTDVSGDPEIGLNGLNAPFNVAMFDAAEEKIQEFEGIIDSISMDSKQASITALNYLDSSDEVMLPRNLYSRGRCQFVYKDHRCRFMSTLKMYATATASASIILVYDSNGKFPLMEMEPGETHIIQIGNEQVLVNSVHATASTQHMAQELWGSSNWIVMLGLLASDKARFAYALNVTRGYNGTSAAEHLTEAPIDILLCRKTFHDCRLHYHEKMFGSFPAIPKQNYNV